MFQMRGQNKTLEEQLRRVEIGRVPKKELRIMIVKMIHDIRKRMGAPQTCHPKPATLADYYFALKANEKRRSRYKQSSLTSLICLKTGHKLVRMFPLPSLPERTEVNPQRQLYTLLSPQMAPEKPM